MSLSNAIFWAAGLTPLLVAQQQQLSAPRPSAIQERAETGSRIFASTCSSCHGLDGLGSERAPNIVTSARTQRLSDREILRVVSEGVPGTGMPPFRSLGDRDLRAVVHYLRTLQGKTQIQSLPGNAEQGKKLFFGTAECSTCHMAKGAGGFIASDLTTYAQTHTAEQIRAAITDPAARDSAKGRATAVTSDGRQYQGVVRNEDNFSLQLQDRDGAFHFLMKSDLKTITREASSIMPSDYGSRLTEGQLNDLVRYVVSLAESPTRPNASDADGD